MRKAVKTYKKIIFIIVVLSVSVITFERCQKEKTEEKGWIEKNRMEKSYCYGTAVIDNKIYIYGGTPSSVFLCYNPATNRFEGTTSYKHIYHMGVAAVAWNNKLYVMGGYGHMSVTNEVAVYDPSKVSWKDLNKMITPRVGLCAAVVGNTLYAIGGSTTDGKMMENCVATVESLDLTSDTSHWKEVAPMNLPRAGATAAVIDGKIYVCGGNDGERTYRSLEVYDPSTDTWVLKTALMDSARRLHGCTVHNGKIYIIGGSKINENCYGPDGNVVSTLFSTVQVYDPSTDTWGRIVAELKYRREGLGAATVNGKIYALSGFCARNMYSEFYDGCVTAIEEYTPE